jgi:hypothetical protein
LGLCPSSGILKKKTCRKLDLFQSGERIGGNPYAGFAGPYNQCHVLGDREEKCDFISLVPFEVKACKKLLSIYKAD